MRKDFLFIILFFAILIISACNNIDLSKLSDKDLERVSKELIVCNAPYIRHATGCCLDKNNNAICDEDEKSIINKELGKNENSQIENPSANKDKSFKCTKEFLQLTSEEQAKLDKCHGLPDQEAFGCYWNLYVGFASTNMKYSNESQTCLKPPNTVEPEEASCLLNFYKRHPFNESILFFAKICDGLFEYRKLSGKLEGAPECYGAVGIYAEDTCLCDTAQYQFQRDECYANFAIMHNQLELCDKIEPNIIYKELIGFNSNDIINSCKRRDYISR